MKLFTDHPNTVGETYFEHMGSAFYFGTTMLAASLACLIHGVLPFLFKTRAKETISKLHTRIVTHRHKDHKKPLGDTLQLDGQ
ncbi:MAG: DUF6356 family protein [Pseudomonadota bacterium]